MNAPHPLFAAHLSAEKEALRQALESPDREKQILLPLLKDFEEVIAKHRAATAHLPIPITPGEVTLALMGLSAENTMKNRERVLPFPQLMTQMLQIFAELLVHNHRRARQAEAKQQPAG